MTTTTIKVTGGVDTHRDTHHAAALDQVGRRSQIRTLLLVLPDSRTLSPAASAVLARPASGG